MFDDETGVYLPAPHKAVKEVGRLGVDGDLLFIYEGRADDWPTKLGRVVRVVCNTARRIVVETSNSVYAGQPS